MAKENSKSLLFVGNKRSGKSAIISRLADHSEQHQSAVALEYTFARANGSKHSKDVCDIWELGGGVLFCNLLDYVINPESLQNLVIILTVDLSQPEELITTVDTLMENIRERIENLLSREGNYIMKENLRQKSRQRFGESHEDASDINPFLAPLVVVGTKYDIFQGYETEKKKAISRFLRLAAHTRAAAIFYTTTKSEVTMNRIRNILTGMAFGTGEAVKSVLDANKALVIPFGGDSFQLIGQVSPDTARTQLVQIFPNQLVSKFVIPDNPAQDPKFAERDIDLVRGMREKDLEDYRRRLEVLRYETTDVMDQ